MENLTLNNKYKAALDGMIYKSNNYGKIKIIDYQNSKDVTVEFLNTGNRYSFEMKAIRDGNIRDALSSRENGKIIWNVGRVGQGKYLPSIHREAYNVWSDVLRRCYSKKDCMKFRSYYKICSVSQEWFNFQNFAEWYYIQPRNSGWEIDKDIICKGNKIYSLENCVFVPSEINLLFIKKTDKNKKFPTGVRCSKNKYKNLFSSRCKDENGNCKHLGSFPTVEEAFLAYKKYKEERIKSLAEKHKTQLTPKVYEAMLKYQVEITD